MKALERLAIQSFVISLALLPDPLPHNVQQELHELVAEGSLEGSIDSLFEIVDFYPPLQGCFRDSRVVQGLRSHSYEFLALQPTPPKISLPTTDDWLSLAISAFSAPDSVGEVNKLLETEQFKLVAEYIKSVKTQLS